MHRNTKTSLKMGLRLGIALAVVALFAPELVQAQDLHASRRPSPMGMTRTNIDDAYLRVVYSRPYKRGRDNVFGAKDSEALIPFGEVWRTGANEATEITLTQDVTVAGKPLAAGTYTVFTTPGEKEWTFHFNTLLGMWGTLGRNPDTGKFGPMYKDSNNALSVTVPAASAEEEVDQFTFAFKDQEDGSTHLVMTWINTEVRVPFAVQK